MRAEGTHMTDANYSSSTFVFHQLPVVTSATYTAQYHVVIRITVSSRGDVLACEAQCFLISYERFQRLWPEHFDDDTASSNDQDVD